MHVLVAFRPIHDALSQLQQTDNNPDNYIYLIVVLGFRIAPCSQKTVLDTCVDPPPWAVRLGDMATISFHTFMMIWLYKTDFKYVFYV